MRELSVEWRNPGVSRSAPKRPLAPPSLPGLLMVAAIGGFIATLLSCALLQLAIAGQRDRAAELDRDIAQARHQVAMLHKEIAIRSRYQELDRWNGVLRLAAPRVDQFLPGQHALAAYSARRAPVEPLPLSLPEP